MNAQEEWKKKADIFDSLRNWTNELKEKTKSTDPTDSEAIKIITDLGFDVTKGEDIFPAEVFNLKSLIWARSHYLARRFPFQNCNIPPIPSHLSDVMENKETGFGGLASLRPFADLFNHKSGQSWLKIDVDEETLEISTNVRVEKGEEIFHNYGECTNETLLLGFGFALRENEDDGVFVRLMSSPSLSSSSLSNVYSSTPSSLPNSHSSLSPLSSLGAFTVKCGGLQGVPKVCE